MDIQETIKQQILQQPKKENESFMDPLLDCLVLLTKMNQHPMSAEALKAGLPLVQNKLTPQLFVRAAQRAGFTSRIMQRSLYKVSELVLPAVLLLNNNQAAILIKKIGEKIEIIAPESDGGVTQIDIKELEQKYSGFVIFLKPEFQFDQRADEFNLASKKSWFWGTLLRYRGIYWQVILAAVLINIFALASPMFIMNVYDRVVPNFAVETLWVLAIGVFIVIGFDLLLRTLRGFLIDVAGKKADTILASTLFHQALGVEMASKPISSGAFANNLREFEILREFFTSATVTTLVDLPFLFLFIALIGVIGGVIAVVPLIAVPIVFFTAYFFEIPIRKAVEQAMFSATQKHAMLVESVSNLEVIKSMSAEGTLLRRWEQYVGVAAQAGLKARFYSTLAINFTAFFSQLVYIVMVIVGVYLIANNKMTTGGLIACVILEGRALAPLAQLAALITRFNQSRLALQGLNKVMELPLERSPDKKFLHRPIFTTDIEFHDVSFKYPGQENFALKGVNLKINCGEKIGILGPMGSGKSTLEKLLLKLYSPSEGAVFIDGIDMAQLDPADIRKNIGYVSQEYSLLFGNVRSNIALGSPWSNDQEILQAARIANVDNFVRQHPAGYAMPIGEYGHGLSGGQRQSIAIARAILSNPQVLILDEPTSALDGDSEQIIIKNLTQFGSGKTIIIVTHKPSMLQLVDRLLILINGSIVADGPKEKILEMLRKGEIIAKK